MPRPTAVRQVGRRHSNLVLYGNDRAQNSAQTNGRSAAGLVMQDDGNLVLYATD